MAEHGSTVAGEEEEGKEGGGGLIKDFTKDEKFKLWILGWR